MTRNDDNGDKPCGGETTWTNIEATRSGRGQRKTGYLGYGMLRPLPNHGLPNDGDDYYYIMVYCFPYEYRPTQ